MRTGIGDLHFWLGDRETAFEWFEKARQRGEAGLAYLGVDPVWDDLRADPRCVPLLGKMGLAR